MGWHITLIVIGVLALVVVIVIIIIIIIVVSCHQMGECCIKFSLKFTFIVDFTTETFQCN